MPMNLGATQPGSAALPLRAAHWMLWAGVVITACYAGYRLGYIETFGFHDWYLFLGAAKQFILSGELYDRDLSHYAPAAAVYKFPPLSGALIVSLLDLGLPDVALRYLYLILHLLCYTAALSLLVKSLPTRNPWFLPIALLLAFTFEPLFENYDTAQLEMYIFLLLAAALHALVLQRHFLSGLCIGVAAAFKIYPLYLAGMFVFQRNWRALGGVLCGLSMATVFSMTLTSVAEHGFYICNILPILLDESVSGSYRNLSLAHALLSLGAPTATITLVGLLVLALPAAITFFAPKPSTDSIPITLSLWICAVLLGMKNSWLNYQLLLLLPLLVCLAEAMHSDRISSKILVLVLLSAGLIFWSNMGKLMFLITLASWLLEITGPFKPWLLQTSLLRGLATGILLLLLSWLHFRQNPDKQL